MKANLVNFMTALAVLAHPISAKYTESVDITLRRRSIAVEPRADPGPKPIDNTTIIIKSDIYLPDEKYRAKAQEYKKKWSEQGRSRPDLTKEEISTFLREEPKGLQGFQGCDDRQKGIIIQTFLSVRTLFFEPLVKDWKDYSIDWTTAAAIEFFGPAGETRPYRDTVKWNLGHTARFLDPQNPLGPTNVRCDDPAGTCYRRLGVIAYVPSIDDNPDYHGLDFINFCFPFFDMYENLQTIAQRIDSMDDPARESLNLEQFMFTREAVMIHEMMHSPPRAFAHRDILEVRPERESLQIPDLTLRIPGQEPKDWGLVYGCHTVRALATGFTKPHWHPVEPSSTAETYPCYLIAEWVKERWGRYPYQPLLALPLEGIENWPYEKADSFPRSKSDGVEYNFTAKKLALENCKELAQPVNITTSFNSSTPVTKTFRLGITEEDCANANWYFDTTSMENMQDASEL
ncbi:hypothetical protein TWF173_001883 [Orbilia oligospora]|nr:hypothetical protein TWF173_001883 [Orbilia oligospora]